MFGKIKDYKIQENKIIIRFTHNTGRVEIIKDSIINIFAGLETQEHDSYAIEGDKFVETAVTVEKIHDRIIIKTKKLIVEVFDDFKVDFYNTKKQLLCADYRGKRKINETISKEVLQLAAMEGHIIHEKPAHFPIEIVKTMNGEEAFYGLGDKTGFLNKRGYEYEMWNSDIPDPHVDSFKSLYKSIPFFITLKKDFSFGVFFDNSYRTYFDMGKESEDYYYFAAEEGNLDYYFLGGENIKEIIENYTYLTGRTPLPQLWTLGYHQSRWSYENREEVLNLAKNFRYLDIPCDSIHLDIDYMDVFKVFTNNEKRFPEFRYMIEDLSQNGFKIVTIIDPGVKIEKGYQVYEEGIANSFFAKDEKNLVYENVVWPGPAVYPDFSDEKVRNWWGDKQQFLLENGVKGVWNDMNEPASFHGELPDDVRFSDEGRGANHKKIHNVYGHLMAKATYSGLRKLCNKRPFVITRACFSGTQKYSTAWTGDNHSIWAHLQMAIPQLCNLGMSGMAFVGTDVGGFGSDCTPELLCRWVQMGCFSPLFRNHSSKGSRRQEPWTFNEETLSINKKYINLRYRLLPYLYDLFHQCEATGIPIIRPLVMEFEQDEQVKEINDEFLFGSHILVAPIVNQGQKVRSVYLPEGNWIDYWTKESIEGGKYILKEAPLAVCPIYIKEGSIIPNYPPIHYVGEIDVSELIVDVYPGVCEYHHFQDNGEDLDYLTGKYNEYCFSIKNSANHKKQLEIRLLNQGYEKIYQSFRILCQDREHIVYWKGETITMDL